jgi:hypothetical protein
VANFLSALETITGKSVRKINVGPSRFALSAKPLTFFTICSIIEVSTEPKRSVWYANVLRFESLNGNLYAQALRRLCSTKNQKAYPALEVLLSHKNLLLIDINEQAGEKKLSAIHYAAKNQNKPMYDLLVKHGARTDLPDANGYTAEDYMYNKT